MSAHQRAALRGNDFAFLWRGSTLGFGTEATKTLSPKLDLRLGFNKLREFDLRNEKGVNEHFGLKLRSTSLLLDWRPFGGSFRTTAGVLISRHRLRVDAVPTQVYGVGDAGLSQIALVDKLNLPDSALDNIAQALAAHGNGTIAARDLLTASVRVRVDSLTPYLGIGWGNVTQGDRRLYYTFDLGVAFHGSPEVDLDVEGIIADLARQQVPQELRASLASEEKKLEEELKDFDTFPVVSFGLLYRF